MGKDVENRPWERDYRGPLLVHAGQARGSQERELITEMLEEGHLDPDEVLLLAASSAASSL